MSDISSSFPYEFLVRLGGLATPEVQGEFAAEFAGQRNISAYVFPNFWRPDQ
jgi:hypothetical protein